MIMTLFRKKLEKGRIKVLGGEPGDRALGLPGALVGFMPQTTRWRLWRPWWWLFFSQPFYGVHCIGDIFLLWAASRSHTRDSRAAKVSEDFFLYLFSQSYHQHWSLIVHIHRHYSNQNNLNWILYKSQNNSIRDACSIADIFTGSSIGLLVVN